MVYLLMVRKLMSFSTEFLDRCYKLRFISTQLNIRCYKLRFISTQLNIRSLLQKQDKAIFEKAKKHDNHSLKVCLPQEKNNLTYNLRRKSFQRPKINTERYRNTFVNILIFKYNLL